MSSGCWLSLGTRISWMNSVRRWSLTSSLLEKPLHLFLWLILDLRAEILFLNFCLFFGQSCSSCCSYNSTIFLLETLTNSFNGKFLRPRCFPIGLLIFGISTSELSKLVMLDWLLLEEIVYVLLFLSSFLFTEISDCVCRDSWSITSYGSL